MLILLKQVRTINKSRTSTSRHKPTKTLQVIIYGRRNNGTAELQNSRQLAFSVGWKFHWQMQYNFMETVDSQLPLKWSKFWYI